MGKRLRSSQGFKREKGKSLLPTQTLVGFSGKLSVRKLKPLRRSKSDRVREKALEQDYFQKCSTLDCRLQDHRNLVELQQQLVCCNGKDFCDSSLCQDLNERHSASIKLIKFLLEQVGTSLEALPKQTQATLCELLYADKSLRVKLQSGFWVTKEQIKASAATQGDDTSSEGTGLYQIFVHGIKHDAPLVLMLKQDDLGQILWNIVLEKCPCKISSSFILLHQGKKIEVRKTLREQGLTTDCNIHVHFSLCGGMEKEKGSQPNDGEVQKSKDPQTWTKGQVAKWITEVCNLCGIDEAEVSILKTLSGAELSNLSPKDWIDRSPKRGDMLFNLWNTRMKTSQERQRVADDTSKTPLASTMKGAVNVKANDVPVGDSRRDTPLGNVYSDGEQLRLPSTISHQKSALGAQGPFGTVEKSQVIDNYLSTDELSKQRPANGAVMSVKGLCSSTPRNHGGAGTLLLRNDPSKGGTFLELKVDIRACPQSTILTKHIISTILGVKLGEELFVRGRVEHFEKGLKSIKKGFEILPFKIIVDSDEHAAFRKDDKLQCSYLRQLSMPWPIECGIFPAEGTTQEPLFENDTLESTPGILYCPPDASIDKIKECAVALKNCQTGDIFVGVSDAGAVIGSKVSRVAVIQKREDLVKALSGILPSVNQPIAICTAAAQLHELVEREKDFVAVMWIQSRTPRSMEDLGEKEDISILFRIHVVKGSSIISFVRPEHTHAYVRVGTETKLMTDYEDLFSRLESLASRNIPKKKSEAIDQEVNKSSKCEVSEQSYHLFKRVNFETEKTEFKAVFGDPKKIILTEYVKKYSASFLNSDGGDILFGIEEDRASKVGFAVGVSMSVADRNELVHESSKIICNFWPPVNSCQFFMKVIEVKCDVNKSVLKYPKTYVEREGAFVAVVLQNMSNIQKLINFLRSKSGQLIAALRLPNNRFGLLLKDSSKLNVENFVSEMEKESTKSKYFQIEMAQFEEIEVAAKDLCVIHLHVRASPYPIHLTSAFLTFFLDQQGMVQEMDPDQLMERFVKRDYQYERDKLFNSVNGFEKENTSYVLISSPFSLPRQERDLYGIVVPEWGLVLDFDQTPNQEGHLLNIFKPLHDLHQVERNLFVKTPLDRKLDLNPRNGVCWCAVRGYEDIDKTLSKSGHASWMFTHGHKMRHLIDQLITHINPNQLVVLCLWDKGHRELLPSLDFILQSIFSCWGPTKVVFVCSDSSTKSEVLSGLVEPLERADYEVKRDNIFVALPHEMARHVGAKLPPPYRSEDEFQIPQKIHLRDGGERTNPVTLPQTIRQAIKGHLQIMYQNPENAFQLKPNDEDKVRVEFYSGSEINETGLATGIAIKREKIEELKRELKSFLNDKRSHVCLTILKAERGAGATTLCLQLLYEFHKQYVCARLLEFQDNLASNIEKINQYSRLPVILFVDSEMAYLPEFNDFKNDAEKRNVNLKLVVVESDALYSQQANSPRRKQPIPYFVGSTPCKTVELSRELTLGEVSQLIEQFLKIREISEEKKNKLKDLKEKISGEYGLRKFAYFSLTVFGRKFTGLPSYVTYRLRQANELQLQILEFLALTHLYTDFLFPVNALARLVEKDVVMLESIFSNDDVRELLSPPSPAGVTLRRISFVEVAEELLQQRAKSLGKDRTLYVKDVALRLAKCALSGPRPSKRIDRITRRLYVTSEYGSEKFSPLVRYLRDEDADVARDMLHELIDVFEKGSSVWAHLLAHLAKYYMIQYGDFPNAIPLIEEAVRENKDDVLLHHIHGDVIRLHVQNLKDQQEFLMSEVLRLAIQSSFCFVTVKEKRPLMEHGYSSDALVRKVVMLAAIKFVGGLHFVDFLKDYLTKRKEKETLTTLTLEDKYILSLVPESFANLRAVPINEFSTNLKESFLENVGDLDDLKSVCEDLKTLSKGTNDEAWVDVVVLKTTSLVCSLEVERKRLDPAEADERIRSLEELLRKTNLDDDSVKIWIRCARLGSKVPSLKSVRSTVDKWLKATGKRSPNALFYNYVVAILEALSDPNDTEKMKRANECVRELLRKRKFPKSNGVSLDPSVPVEWLHPKDGRHINSIDSLLYHEDLVRDYLQGRTPQHQKRRSKEIIEKALFEKTIREWEGVVSEISSDWKGTIIFKKHIHVPFVPVNVQPHMPNEGDTVRFCLAFHWTGPCAWYVVCQPGVAKAQKAVARSTIRFPEEGDTDSETSDKDDEDSLLPLVGQSLHTQTVRPQKNFTIDEVNESHQWGNYLDCERRGIIVQVIPKNGFGFIHHPDFKDYLFFHKKQIDPPVDNLSSIEVFSVVSFTVGKREKGFRAMNIRTVEEKDIDSQLKSCREELRRDEQLKKLPSSASEVPQRSGRMAQLPNTLEDFYKMGSRQEGHVCQVRAPPQYRSVRGFINVPSTSERLYFEEMLSGIPKKEIGNIQLETIVQFSVDKNKQGFFAKNLFIKLPESKTAECRCGWEDCIGKGIQEGFIGFLKPGGRYGFITKTYARERYPTGIYFNESQLREYSFGQLRLGDRVHFVVGQNEKGGCVAKQIDVLREKDPFPAVSQGNYPSGFSDPRLFSGNPHGVFLHGQPNLGHYSHLSPPFGPNAMPRYPLYEPGGHTDHDGGFQEVNYRRRKR